MTEFAKIASAVKMWGWGRAGMVLAAVLLLKHVVTFDQAVILILVNVVLDRLVYGKQPSPRSTNGRSSGMDKIGVGGRNRSSRLKASRFVPAVDWPPQPPNVIAAGSELTASCALDVWKMQSLINDP